MKRSFKEVCITILLLSLFFSKAVYAIGDGNVDHGGGGMGEGSSLNFWKSGDEGVRLTIVNALTGSAASQSIDLTNKNPDDIGVHFGKGNKAAYCTGASLSPHAGGYIFYTPRQSLPKIIKSAGGGSSISAIKSYFTDEQTLRGIADYCGFDFDTLVSGEYKLLIEPVAYVTLEGTRTALTATEAALYDRMRGGLLQSKMPSLSHKNLPLSLFLEKDDLGFSAWTGSRTGRVGNEEIISSLGLGIVKFKEPEKPPEIITADYEYRVDTDVITSVTVDGGQSDPDHPVTVTFHINGQSYMIENVYYPEGRSQLVWVQWHTPSVPQYMEIEVTVEGGGRPGKGLISANIVDLSGKDPPNPVADDRNDSYDRAKAEIPQRIEKTTASWGLWIPWWQQHLVWHSDIQWESLPCDSSCLPDCSGGHGHEVDKGRWVDEGWWMFDYKTYTASLDTRMTLMTDQQSPTATEDTIKSGYGVQIEVEGKVSTDQNRAVTGVQTAVSYFPEFYYQTYWRLLEREGSGSRSTFSFRENPYSTYRRKTHFTPVWMRDGSYIVYTWLLDCWTPEGMLCKNLTDGIQIQGNLWQDWHCAPTS